jgi:hypothetical protein
MTLLSVCVCVYPFIIAGRRLGKNPLIVARQLLGKTIPLSLLGNGSEKLYRGNKYTRNNRRIVGRVVLREVGDWFSPELFIHKCHLKLSVW